MNDQRLKYLLNEELKKLGQPLIDCGDEWTELIERVVQKLISEREADLKAEVERLRTELVQRLRQLFYVGAEVGRLTRENEALRGDVARAEKLLQGDSHEGCAVIEMQLKALLREWINNEEITNALHPLFSTTANLNASGCANDDLLNRSRTALGKGR